MLSAMMMTVLLVSVVASIAYRHHLDLNRVSRTFNADQAFLLALSAEMLALKVLDEDADPDVDSLSEDWAQESFPLPVEGGLLLPRIRDLSGRFNINSLATVSKKNWRDFEKDPTKGANELAVFHRLRTVLDLGQNPQIIARVVDWLDNDDELLTSGSAENRDYLIQDPARRAANRLMSDVYELLEVADYPQGDLPVLLLERDDEDVQREPVIAALPDTNTGFNINTASKPFIMALHPDINDVIADLVIDSRPFSDQRDFYNLLGPNLGNATAESLEAYFAQYNPGIRSNYFELTVLVELGDTRAQMVSHIYRDQNYNAPNTKPVVYARHFIPLPDVFISAPE